MRLVVIILLLLILSCSRTEDSRPADEVSVPQQITGEY